jgi:hypothetical protein
MRPIRPLPERRPYVSRYAGARTLQQRSLRQILQVESSNLLCSKANAIIGQFLSCVGLPSLSSVSRPSAIGHSKISGRVAPTNAVTDFERPRLVAPHRFTASKSTRACQLAGSGYGTNAPLSNYGKSKVVWSTLRRPRGQQPALASIDRWLEPWNRTRRRSRFVVQQ